MKRTVALVTAGVVVVVIVMTVVLVVVLGKYSEKTTSFLFITNPAAVAIVLFQRTFSVAERYGKASCCEMFYFKIIKNGIIFR